MAYLQVTCLDCGHNTHQNSMKCPMCKSFNTHCTSDEQPHVPVVNQRRLDREDGEAMGSFQHPWR